MSEDSERKLRAQKRRERITLAWKSLDAQDEDDDAVFGAEAISLAAELSEEAWALSGQPWPDYDRANMPIRFINGYED